MKAVCKLEALQKVIGLVGSVVPVRSTQPALQNLLLSVEKETLTASATDLDVGLCVEVPVEKGSEAGQVGLRGADFAAIVREADAEEIEIEATGAAAKVHAGTILFMSTGFGPGLSHKQIARAIFSWYSIFFSVQAYPCPCPFYAYSFWRRSWSSFF